VFGIAAAKFAAESQAEGVGEQAVLAILEARQKVCPVFSDFLIETLRKLWREMPRIPDGATDQIAGDLARVVRVVDISKESKSTALYRIVGKEVRHLRPKRGDKSLRVSGMLRNHKQPPQ
jgi:hypothetical protein